jgi:DNA repair exonuclease SbcCD ATPase subunit
MPNDTGKLYLYEALELRSVYDREIRLLGRLLKPEEGGRGAFLAVRDSAERRPAAGFDPDHTEVRLKRLRVKRLKLNEAIQVANFQSQIAFDGESVSLARALELRKALLQDLEELAERVQEAAYVRIIHKEERDIEKLPPRPFEQAYKEFQEALERLRTLVTALHRANHEVPVAFRDE